MASIDDIRNIRLEKIKTLRDMGINPYPSKSTKDVSNLEVTSNYDNFENKKIHLAGRIISWREHGQLIFGHIQDQSGKIQILIKKDELLGTDIKKQIIGFEDLKLIDTGDFIEIFGTVGKSIRGEISIFAQEIKLLSKSIRILPEKWSGLQDPELIFRHRYLDLVMNPEVKKVFEKREKILESIREFLKLKEFNEVETPYLQTVYGGAAARPFKTHINALDMDLFLAISPELYLKRLIVGGYEKVFTIARNFRNEGIDRWHNPEFTMMEIYQAYADYNDMMKLTEDLFEYVAKKVNGTTKVNFKGKEIDFKAPWQRMTMAEAIKKFAKIDVLKMNDNEIAKFAKENKLELKSEKWGYAVQSVFEHFCEEKIEQPTFITDHPIESTPLCKQLRNGDKRLIERFEPFCMGTELANAYSELNDPILQKQLLEEQQKMLKKGDDEANPYDSDFVNAIEIGLPPTGGLGIGIDRMIILLTGQESIRDIILFPFMKPEENQENK